MIAEEERACCKHTQVHQDAHIGEMTGSVSRTAHPHRREGMELISIGRKRGSRRFRLGSISGPSSGGFETGWASNSWRS